jgi:hypothetical protein
MDMVIRCCVEPRFLVDKPMLEQHLVDVRAAKAQLLVDANNIDPRSSCRPSSSRLRWKRVASRWR